MSARRYVPVLHDLREALSAAEGLFTVAPERRAGLVPLLLFPADSAADLPRLAHEAFGDAPFYAEANETFCKLLREHGASPIPVVRTDTPDATLQTLAGPLGLALRIEATEGTNPARLALLHSFPARAGLPPTAIDLLLDLGDVSGSFVAPLRARLTEALAALPLLASARRVVVLGSSVPSLFDPDVAESELQRLEWIAFRDVASQPGQRALDFGDHPGLPASPPLSPDVHPHVRWVIRDGLRIVQERRSSDAMPHEERHAIARRLVEHPTFPGFLHCPGCHLASDGSRRPGTLADRAHLRRVELMHHLAAVTEQVAKLPVP